MNELLYPRRVYRDLPIHTYVYLHVSQWRQRSTGFISDPHRGCFMGLSTFIFFFFFFSFFFFLFSFYFFFRHDFVRPISLEPLLAETPNLVCCLVLRSSCALLLTIQFTSLFFFFFFPPRFCPGHISGTVTRRDSKLSVLLGPAV